LRAQDVHCPDVAIGGVGPWDYNDPDINTPTGADPMGRLKRVENVHFKPAFEQLIGGPEQLTADITYTLRAIPNHYRALLALSRLEHRLGDRLPKLQTEEKPTAECYFIRAFRFRPDDPKVLMAYGMHLQTRKRYKEALASYERAESLGISSSQFWYNYGLLMFELKDYEKSAEYAERAYSGGWPLPGLANKLKAAGHPLK
jgi:tetratricopeptide (TPR) repeat protein